MSRERDTRAEFAARDRRAVAMGYRSNRERTEARKAARTGDTSRLRGGDRPTGIVARIIGGAVRIVAPKPKPAPGTRIGKRAGKAHAGKPLPKFFQTPAVPGVLVMNSTDSRAIVDQLRKAAGRGDHVTIRATVNDDGDWRTVTVDGYTDVLSAFLGSGGDVDEVDSPGDRSLFSGKLQFMFGPASAHQNGGIRAIDLINSLGNWSGDFWPWLHALLTTRYKRKG